MQIKFSQKQFAKTPQAMRIRGLIQFCVPKSPRYRDGLLVKVLCYTGKEYLAYWRGHYANGEVHGLYDNDWNAGATSVITLKIGLNVPIDTILYLIAHEVGHHISYVRDARFGEKKADKIAARIIQRYNKSH